MARRPRRSSRARKAAFDRAQVLFLRELEAVYRAADELYEGRSCEQSTDCCRFAVTGREPYVTSVELAAVERAIAALGGFGALASRRARPSGGEAHPEARRLPLAPSDRPCPLLSPSGRCMIYAARPIGCRTFYCARAGGGEPVTPAEVRALVRRIQEIAARHEPGGDLGRPLSRALGR